MDTRLATTQIRLQEWTAIIQDRSKSGLTVDAYCRQHNISRHAYFYWLHKVKEAALTHVGFVEVKAPQPISTVHADKTEPANFTPALILSINSVQLQLSETTSADLLTRVMEVIRRC